MEMFPLQVRVPAAVIFFVAQVVKQGINTFALAADAENIGFRATLEVDEFADESSGGESVAFIAVEGCPRQGDEVGTVVFVSVFEGVERIEQYPAHESDLGTAVGGAVGCPELFSGHIF